MSVPLSVLVLTKNEERNIGACLDSVAGWASDIVVVDSGSDDRTLAICAEHDVRTTYHAYADHRSQINWGMTEVLWQHEWLLLLDADNVVTPEFRRDIEQMLRADNPTVHGYYNPHHHYFRHQRVRGLKPEWLRLVRRSHVKVDDSELVDFRLVVNGTIGRMPGAIIESNANELSIDFWIDKHQKFARRMAIEEILRAEKVLAWSSHLRPTLLGNPDERMIWLKNIWYGMPLYVRPVLLFLYRYFIRQGFLDGWNGFVYHSLQTFWFRLIVDVHIADYRGQLRRHTLSLDQLVEAGGLPAPTLHQGRS